MDFERRMIRIFLLVIGLIALLLLVLAVGIFQSIFFMIILGLVGGGAYFLLNKLFGEKFQNG